MPRDKKLGLGLGILLVGIVAALFFRNEPPAPTPELNDPESLDRQIAEREVAPYLEPRGSDHGQASETVAASRPDRSAWDLPEFLQGDGGTPTGAPAPDPIPSDAIHERPTSSVSATAPEGASVVAEPETHPAEPAGPPTASPPESQPGVLHRVAQGDTLSDLAAHYLGSSGRFLEIYEANRDVLRGPNDLRVGLTLRIPARGDAPRRQSTATVRVSDIGEPANDGATAGAVSVSPAIEQHVQPPATAAQISQPAPRVRFRPVRRSPLRPGTSRAATSDTHSEPRTSGRVLTQKPPVDLLPLEDVFTEDDRENPGATPPE